MGGNDDEALLETALMAARTAGQFLSKEFGRPRICESKADSSIVSDADIRSEELIKELITKRHPDHSFWGEETGRTDLGSPYVWVVDPLDGTKNFVRGVPLFSVEVALLRSGNPLIGVSNLPIPDDLLWAVRGKGAHSNRGPVQVSRVTDLKSAYVSFGNLKHFERRGSLPNLLSLLAHASQCRGIGDSWSLHFVARGAIDVFIDARTDFWDIAALSVILEEAGGRVTDIRGEPINEYCDSVLASNEALHAAALSYLLKT